MKSVIRPIRLLFMVVGIAALLAVMYQVLGWHSRQKPSVPHGSRGVLSGRKAPLTTHGREAEEPQPLPHAATKAPARQTTGEHGGYATTTDLTTPAQKADPPAEPDYAYIDEALGRIAPLDSIGIPVVGEPTSLTVFSPNESDRQQIEAIEGALLDAAEHGLLSRVTRENYHQITRDGKSVYVHPTFQERYEELLRELTMRHDRSMRSVRSARVPAGVYDITTKRGRTLPDGTVIEYYRRKDGALIRSAKRPNGTQRRWVIGWANLSAYAALPDIQSAWRDE